MQKFAILFMLILAYTLIGCQTTETTAEGCTASLSDIMADQMIMGISGVTVESVTDAPVTGSLTAEEIKLNTESLIMGRYNSSETAVNLLTPASLTAAFGNDVTIKTDVPTVYGDETAILQFQSDTITEGAIARYGNRLVMAKASTPDGVTGMFSAFDNALLDFIDENPACVTLHPNTR